MRDDGLPLLSASCGYCNAGMIYPESWWSPELGEDDPPSPPAGIYRCLKCGAPTVVTFDRQSHDDDERPEPRAQRISPDPPPAPLGVKQFAGSTLEKYRDEAWASYRARRYRTSIVVARSAVQACCRRYVPKSKWGRFIDEANEMSALAGTGWDKIAGEVRQFGNQWAHPDPESGADPTWKDAREALDRMDAVLQFIGALERFGHLAAVNGN